MAGTSVRTRSRSPQIDGTSMELYIRSKVPFAVYLIVVVVIERWVFFRLRAEPSGGDGGRGTARPGSLSKF